jgi:hypothetical protein
VELKLHFSEEEMAIFLNKHHCLSMPIDTYDIDGRSGKETPCIIDFWWKAGVKPDFEKLKDKPRSAFYEHSLEYLFLKEMKAQLLKL